MNTPKIGRIYHVVDKATQETVKVGSTTQFLSQRFNAAYRRKHSNHFLREVRVIESNEFDWYKKGDYDCPFLWHLAAIEHLEMLKMNTYRKGPLSNKQSPLDQKAFGFVAGVAGTIGGQIGGKIGGKINGRKRVESGALAALRTPEHQSKAGKAAGRLSVENKTGIHHPNFDRVAASKKAGQKNVESGHIYRISTPEGRLKGGITQGRINAESGYMSRLGKNVPFEVRSERGKRVGPWAMHIRWHVNRGIKSESCRHCSEG